MSLMLYSVLLTRTFVSADVIVCLDACFAQKRRKKPQGEGQDQAEFHPESVFLSEAKVKDMERIVNTLRPSHSSAQRKPESPAQDEDGYEHSMRVPISILNGCEASFAAADEKRIKASTQFFSDTGIMGLLYRHDHVLWLVNITSPGERQHYSLALIKELFDHLPPSMRVGVLYDIGCQLHRSCIKWGFLDQDILDRIIFGISVFHAFGHQWACQLIYHPHKCKGFGLRDGEGCERFWSSIKLLIPSTCVSGVGLTQNFNPYIF